MGGAFADATGKSLPLLNRDVSSSFRKNILIFRSNKSVYIARHPIPARGALRNVINAGRAAVDAEGLLTRVPDADGKNVWS
jgi:hypothetical protein